MTIDQPSPKRGWRDVAAEDHSHIQTRASEAAERFAAKRSERRALPTVTQGGSSPLDAGIIEDAEKNSWRTSSSRDQLRHQQIESPKSYSNDAIYNQETCEEYDKRWRDFTLTDDAVRAREEERRTKMETKAAQRKKRADKAKRDWSKQKTQPDKHNNSHSQDRAIQPRQSRRSKVNSSQAHRQEASSTTRSSTARSSRQPTSEVHQSSASYQDRKRSHPKDRSSKNKKRTKPPIDASWVKRSGMYYLGRFNASEAHFRSVLMTKIKRAESRVSDDPQEHIQWVDAAVEEGRLFGALNDEQLALGLARSYRRRGLARGASRQKLRQKKLASDHIESALDEVYTPKEGEIDPTLNAAARTAKKKRIGPWGPDQVDYPTKQKQLAKLARRGFSYSVAQKVLNASLEEAEVWLEGNS